MKASLLLPQPLYLFTFAHAFPLINKISLVPLPFLLYKLHIFLIMRQKPNPNFLNKKEKVWVCTTKIYRVILASATKTKSSEPISLPLSALPFNGLASFSVMLVLHECKITAGNRKASSLIIQKSSCVESY